MKSIEEIELYAKENYIPIARKPTIDFLINLFKENNYKSFLEIGTAIGYTSSIIASLNDNINILTIEYDTKRAEIAKQNFKDFNVEKQIDLVIDDAKFYNVKGLYDVIFIDAAKKRNNFFLVKFSINLSKNGTIVIDNMNLDDFWINANVDKKKEYDEVNKKFKEYLLSLKEYDVKIYDDIGDGIATLTKK